MADYPYYDEDPKRRRRRKRRRDYSDDALGMAYDADMADGEYGDELGDYAGGMVYEQGRHRRFYDPDPYADDYDTGYLPATPEMHHSSERSERPVQRGLYSDAVDRAADLMSRMGRNTSYRPASRETMDRYRPERQRATKREPRQERPADMGCLDSLFNAQFNLPLSILIPLLVVAAVACGCVTLALYAIFG
ncbi:MAG: hypothetical protein GYB66_13015 [Chloroflexi bacterium]|nr:hypothetical protein [Chloroflexota bacterium]